MRLFVALVPPEGALRDLPRRTGREHVTLAFLGEVPDPSALLRSLPAVQEVSAPRVRLAGAGRFGRGAVWLGVHGDLAPLHAQVQRAVALAGLPVAPGPWRPHLTIGRGGRVPSWAVAHEGREHVWDEVALVRSTLTRAGAVHEPLAAWRLPAGDQALGPSG